MISQFGSEREELYPPLTMLRVKSREECAVRTATPDVAAEGVVQSKTSVVGAQQASDWWADAATHEKGFVSKWQGDFDKEDNKTFLRIVVEPSFV